MYPQGSYDRGYYYDKADRYVDESDRGFYLEGLDDPPNGTTPSQPAGPETPEPPQGGEVPQEPSSIEEGGSLPVEGGANETSKNATLERIVTGMADLLDALRVQLGLRRGIKPGEEPMPSGIGSELNQTSPEGQGPEESLPEETQGGPLAPEPKPAEQPGGPEGGPIVPEPKPTEQPGGPEGGLVAPEPKPTEQPGGPGGGPTVPEPMPNEQPGGPQATIPPGSNPGEVPGQPAGAPFIGDSDPWDRSWEVVQSWDSWEDDDQSPYDMADRPWQWDSSDLSMGPTHGRGRRHRSK